MQMSTTQNKKKSDQKLAIQKTKEQCIIRSCKSTNNKVKVKQTIHLKVSLTFLSVWYSQAALIPSQLIKR